jgi:hypothetical protein
LPQGTSWKVRGSPMGWQDGERFDHEPVGRRANVVEGRGCPPPPPPPPPTPPPQTRPHLSRTDLGLAFGLQRRRGDDGRFAMWSDHVGVRR